MKYLKHLRVGVLVVSSAPVIVFAQSESAIGLVDRFVGYFNGVVALIIGLAFVGFLWQMLKIMTGPTISIGKDGKKISNSSNRSMILYGVVLLTFIVSLWGIVRWMKALLVDGGAQPRFEMLPEIKQKGGKNIKDKSREERPIRRENKDTIKRK